MENMETINIEKGTQGFQEFLNFLDSKLIYTELVTNAQVGSFITSLLPEKRVKGRELLDQNYKVDNIYEVGLYKNLKIVIDPNMRWDDTTIRFYNNLEEKLLNSNSLRDELNNFKEEFCINSENLI